MKYLMMGQQSKKYDAINKKQWDNLKNEGEKQITVASIIYWLKNNVNVKELFSSIKYNVDNYIERPIIISDKINKS